LFGIMLTRGALGEDEEANTEKRRMAALVGVLVLVVTGGAVLDSFGDAAVNRSAPSLTSEIGDTIFSQYIVPFEAVSVLLLAALIGAIVVARQD
jgi:NADH-quinone oxidoreductase subunit J